jgi:hypothetical protein
MEEIRLWKVSGPQDSPTITDISSVAQTQTEEMLEEVLVKSPNLLSDGLKLVGRQIETRGGPLDLLGVDEDGRLVIYELKRGLLTRDAVAQIVDYASYLAGLSSAEIYSLITDGSGKYGIDKIDDFVNWYQEQFGKSPDIIGKPKMVLVGLGVDERARRMVEFLAKGDIEISLITFHGFNDNGEVFLARQIEVAQKQTAEAANASKAANLQKLLKRIKTSGVEAYFEKAASLIRSGMNANQWPNQTGYSYYFQDITDSGTPSNRTYLSLSIPGNPWGSMLLSLQERAIRAAGQEWAAISRAWGARVIQRKGYIDVRIASGDDWEHLEPEVRRLCAAIVEGRKSLQEKSLQEQKAVAEREVVEELSEAQA